MTAKKSMQPTPGRGDRSAARFTSFGPAWLSLRISTATPALRRASATDDESTGGDGAEIGSLVRRLRARVRIGYVIKIAAVLLGLAALGGLALVFRWRLGTQSALSIAAAVL